MLKIKRRPVPTNCPFCKTKIEPLFNQLEGIAKYVTERGRIVGKAKSGLCSKHQRRLTRSIKQARYIGLLPFVIRPH